MTIATAPLRVAGTFITLALAGALAGPATPHAVGQTGPQWIDIEGPNGAQRAAVFRPSGPGPFPVVVVLHGGEGIAQGFLDWASRFAGDGYVVLVGCWARHNSQAIAARGATLGVACPNLPPPLDARLQATGAAETLIKAARGLSGVRPDAIGLIGLSWGATLAALAASSGVQVQAVVAIAGAFRDKLSRTDVAPLERVASLQAPILLIHGKSDTTVNPEETATYEAAARAAGKNVEVLLVDGADHFTILRSEEARPRILAFLNRYLRP